MENSVKPIKSETHHQDYEIVTLPNQLKILLISDKYALKSSCAISIGVGSLQDPDEVLGLAHFLQHMIFMGSVKYPKHNDYSSFMSKNAGYQNAQTNDANTNIYFEIQNQAFQQAIVRTVDCIVNPLIPQQYLSKQRQAIHEQFILAKNDDESRIQEVYKIFAIKPYNRFSMGNQQTLKHPETKTYLTRFHEIFYSADIMNVVLYNNLPVNQMKFKFTQYFEAILNKNSSNLIKNPTVYFKQNTKYLLKIQSIKNAYGLHIYIPLENMAYEDRQQLAMYLQYVLSHPGDHTLNSILQEKQVAESCELKHIDCVDYSFLVLQISLNDEEEEQIDKILGVVFQYLTKRLKAQKVLYQEKQAINRMNFICEEIDEMEDYLCELAVAMNSTKSEQLLHKGHFMKQFNQEKLNNLLKCVNKPQKYLLILITPDNLKNQKIQPYYQTKYLLEEVPEIKIPKKMPKNKQIKKNKLLKYLSFEVYPSPNKTKYTPIFVQQYNIHFYHHPQANKPMGSMQLILHTSQEYTFSCFFAEFMDSFMEECDQGLESSNLGLDYTFNYQLGHLYLQINGHSSLVIQFLKSLARSLLKTLSQIKEKQFDDLQDMVQDTKQSLQNDIDNYYEQQMDDLCDKIRDQILIQKTISLSSLQKEVQKLKKRKFLQEFAKVWSQSVFQWIFVGNFQLQNVCNICKSFNQQINPLNSNKKQVKKYQNKILQLSQGNKKVQIRLPSSDITISTCLSYYQAGPYSQRLLFQLQIIKNYLDQPFFNQLRTQKKLSYDLEITITYTRGILGICFLLTSSKVDPATISSLITEFLTKWTNPQKIKPELSQSIEQLKKSVKTSYLEQPSTTSDMLDFISDCILNRTYYFHIKQEEQLNKRLDQITIEQLVQKSDLLFNKEKQKSIDIMLVSKHHKQVYRKKISKPYQIEKLKKDGDYYNDTLSSFLIRNYAN